jgi:hypothetical protein
LYHYGSQTPLFRLIRISVRISDAAVQDCHCELMSWSRTRRGIRTSKLHLYVQPCQCLLRFTVVCFGLCWDRTEPSTMQMCLFIVDSRLGRLCAKEQERHSTYIVECNTNIANTSQGASRLDGLMNTLFPHDHCQRFDTTELAIRSEQVITCRLCSCDSGHNGD